LGRKYIPIFVGKTESAIKQSIEECCSKSIFIENCSRIGDVYASLDCFVLASSSEAFSLSLTEAWLAGVPTVSTPVGAVLELEEQYGRMTTLVQVNPSDEELAEAVLEAIDNREIVDNAKNVVKNNF